MKQYRVTVSFGDGNPKTEVIEAENGYNARMKAFNSFAGARHVHVLGLVSDTPKVRQEPPALVYGKEVLPSVDEPKSRYIPIRLKNNEVNPIVLEAIRLRREGLTQEKIAKTLGISRGAVRRLINANV